MLIVPADVLLASQLISANLGRKKIKNPRITGQNNCRLPPTIVERTNQFSFTARDLVACVSYNAGEDSSA